MKTPLVYPKITDTTNCPLKRCYAYEKLDGTNIHWYWNKQDSFYAFGTRRDRFPMNAIGEKEFREAHPGLERVVSSFLDCGEHRKLAENLDEFLSGDHRGKPKFSHIPKIPYSVSEVIIFTEYFGIKSFAGQHQEDDHKDHYLIDVMVDGQLVVPDIMEHDFIDFRWCMPRVIYRGKYTGDLVDRVRKGQFPVQEGAVIKGTHEGQVYMAKVKTDSYMESLKAKFKDKWKDYWE